MKKLSLDDGIAFDVGANIGFYSLILSKLVKKVVAFEPEPMNLKLLNKNIHENKIRNIEVIGMAVSDNTSKLHLGLSTDNFGDHQINSIDEDRKNITVESTNLDSHMSQKVALLKIDTQGWEPKVIDGAKKLIIRDKPTIFMEFWPEGYKRSGLDFTKMMNFLEEVYGKIYLIDDRLNLVYPINKDSLQKRCKSKKGYLDLLFKSNMTTTDVWICLCKFRIKKIFSLFRLA